MSDPVPYATFIRRGGKVISPLYLIDKSAKSYKVSVTKDGRMPMWLSRKYCRIIQQAKDGEREVFEIPDYQAEYHRQFTESDGDGNKKQS